MALGQVQTPSGELTHEFHALKDGDLIILRYPKALEPEAVQMVERLRNHINALGHTRCIVLGVDDEYEVELSVQETDRKLFSLLYKAQKLSSIQDMMKLLLSEFHVVAKS